MIFFKNSEFNTEILKIINSYKIDELSFSITFENKKESCFALLFAIFLSDLTLNSELIFKDKKKLYDKVIENFLRFTKNKDIFEKSYLQLLTLTLSALYIIDSENISFKEKFIKDVESNKIKVLDYLNNFKCLKGKPSSGNYAMFLAIVLIYLDRFLGTDKKKEIDYWVKLHLENVNINGLWGDDKNFYAYFQNGYHQYEIFKYLKLNEVPIKKATEAVSKLLNKYGGFAPYPGGGACYDYDAIFFLTYTTNNIFLKKNYTSILKNFRLNFFPNLGFSENIYCRPLNFKNFYKVIINPFEKIDERFTEKLISSVSILRHKNKVIKNQFSEKPYEWNKPNLFATWFRIMSIARIEKNLGLNNNWKFINFPGIGF